MKEDRLLIGLLTFLEKEGGNNFIDKAEIVSKYKDSISDNNKYDLKTLLEGVDKSNLHGEV